MLKKLLLNSVLIMIASSGILAQGYGYKLPKHAKQHTFDFEQVQHYIVLNVRVNHFFTLKFILDTGSRYNILFDKSYAASLGLSMDRKFPIMGADRQVMLETFIDRNVHFGIAGLEAEAQTLLILDESVFDLEQRLGTPIHGILGADLFRQFTVSVNYKNSTISVSEPNQRIIKRGYERHSIAVRDDKPYMKVRVHGHGERGSQEKDLLLDTGCGAPLLLQVEPKDTAAAGRLIPGELGIGLGGAIQGYMGRVPVLEFAGRSLVSPVVGYLIPKALDSLFEKPIEGMVGNAILSRFNIIYDYANSAIWLKPLKQIDDDFEFDKSGLWVYAVGEQLDRFMVQGVIENSAAAQAGIKPGDYLLAINGRSTKTMDLRLISRKLSSKTGKRIRLKVLNSHGVHQVEFKLRDII